MTDAVRVLVRISVAIGADDRAGLREALRDAQAIVPAAAVDEALLQSYLFAGFPRALNAFQLWREVSPVAAQEAAAADDAEWLERGRVVFAQVYGEQHARVLANAAVLHPDLARWMLVEGYGKVLGRSGLDLPTRELCIIALLATQDALPQLYSHLRGALHVGADENDVSETLTLALARASGERSMRAQEAWETVRSRRGG